jgi:hypothetical protein
MREETFMRRKDRERDASFAMEVLRNTCVCKVDIIEITGKASIIKPR